MKAKHICPKCDGREILHLSQVNDFGDEYRHGINDGLGAEPQLQPNSNAWRIARLPYDKKTKSVSSTGSEVATAGVVEAYVCRGCGFTELYTRDPQRIPVDGVVARLISGPPKASSR